MYCHYKIGAQNFFSGKKGRISFIAHNNILTTKYTVVATKLDYDSVTDAEASF